jgi:hypothetical protein
VLASLRQPLTGRRITSRPTTGRRITSRRMTGRRMTGRPTTGRRMTGRPTTGRRITLPTAVYLLALKLNAGRSRFRDTPAPRPTFSFSSHE